MKYSTFTLIQSSNRLPTMRILLFTLCVVLLASNPLFADKSLKEYPEGHQWFSKICHNVITDRKRKNDKAPRTTGDTASHQQLNQKPTKEAGPLSRLLETEMKECHSALLKCRRAMLPSKGNQQMIFELHFVHEKSISEIAGEIRIGEGAVSAARQRILKRLRMNQKKLEAVMAVDKSELGNEGPISIPRNSMNHSFPFESYIYLSLAQQCPTILASQSRKHFG